jgi:hypothetical protein
MAIAATEKGRAILKAKEIFPEFNIMDYDISLARNLSYYNTEIDDSKKKKEWAISFWKSEGKDTSKISKISDGYFNTVGAVAHMIKFRNIELDDRDTLYMTKKYNDFKSMTLKFEAEPVTDEEKVQVKAAKAETELTTHITEFELGVDLFFKNKDFNFKSYLLRNNVKPVIMKQIAAHFKPMLTEVEFAISKKDAQVTEAYSFMQPRQLTKFMNYLKGIFEACESASAVVKVAKAPKAKRAKPTSELVKNVKYLVSDETSKLTSITPARIVNASEAWIYNAKTRRLFRYIASTGSKLTIKGTSIINIDDSKSGGKIIRKPESQLPGIQKFSSKVINTSFNEIRSTESVGSGRLSEDTLIVAVF